MSCASIINAGVVCCVVVPVKTMNQLLITWPLPSQMKHYRCIIYWLTAIRCYFMSQ